MKILNSLFLFKALIKAGCRWEGDVSHRLFTERLYFDESIRGKVLEIVAPFSDVTEYKIEDNSVWIA